MQTKDGLALIADPDPKVSGRAESHRQKHCEILAYHSRVLVPIKSIEEDIDAIQSPMLLSQYPELHGRYGKPPRFIWKDPSKVSHRTKRLLHLELKKCIGAWLFTRTLAVNREYQTDLKNIMHDLKGFIQRINATADYIAWASRESADRRPDLVIQYPRFVATYFLPLFIQPSDSGLRTGCQCGPLDKFDARLLFLKDLSEITVARCDLFAVLADRVAHISMKCCVARPADNSEIGMKTALKWWRKVTERKFYQIFLTLYPICEVLDTASSQHLASRIYFSWRRTGSRVLVFAQNTVRLCSGRFRTPCVGDN
jgi:hypothetical protein